MTRHKIYDMSVSSVYPHYINKVERKGQNKDDVDTVTRWLTGYSQDQLEKQLEDEANFEDFFNQAPQLNENRKKLKDLSVASESKASKNP